MPVLTPKMKGVYYFLLIRFFSTFGTQIVLFAAPLIVFKYTESIAYSGLSFSIEWGIGMLALPLAGVLSDRFGGARLFMLSDFMRVVACVSCFLLLANFPGNVFLIVSVSAGVLAFCLNTAFVALESALPRYMPVHDLHKAQSLLQTIDQLSLLLGPVAATLLFALVGEMTLYLIAAGAFSVSFATFFLFRPISEVSANARVQSPLANLQSGAAILFGDRRLVLLCVYGILVNLVSCALLSIGAAMVTGTYGLPESYFGLLNVIAALATIALMFLVPTLKSVLSMRALGLISTLGVAAGGFIVSFATGYWIYAGGFALAVAADAMAGVYLRTERVMYIPKDHLGKTLGIMVLVIVLSYPLAGLIVGAFSERIGMGPLIAILSVASLVGNLFVMKALSGYPTEPMPEVPTVRS
jgi:MFS family permease